MRLPNFIVIGAAKAGTTALYWYLAEHPAIFMSPVKETNFFAYGLDETGRPLFGDPEVHRFPITSLEQYRGLFAEAGSATAVGEASTMYLECPQSAGRIRELLPGVRLICGLRHPVDRAYSDYQMYLRNRGRTLDPARDLVATAPWAQPDSHYMQVGMYHAQLERYYAIFPREQIHIFLFDDLQRQAAAVVEDVYRFLGVDSSFSPDFDTPHNVGGMPASPLLERLLTKGRLRRLLGPWVPATAVNWLRRLRTRTMRPAPALPGELRQALTEAFRDDIGRTSKLIGRNLDQWVRPPDRGSQALSSRTPRLQGSADPA